MTSHYLFVYEYVDLLSSSEFVYYSPSGLFKEIGNLGLSKSGQVDIVCLERVVNNYSCPDWFLRKSNCAPLLVDLTFPVTVVGCLLLRHQFVTHMLSLSAKRRLMTILQWQITDDCKSMHHKELGWCCDVYTIMWLYFI